MEFRLANVQEGRDLIEVDVCRREADGFTDPEPRTGQEPDDGRDGIRPEGALGAQVLGSLDQGRDLLGCQEIGCGAAEGRDQALLLLLARLGLRAHEVVTLRLDDIDWRQGHLRLPPGKTHHERLLPLSHEVGEVVVWYLRQGRPTSTSRRVLLNSRAPFRPFAGASAITQIAQRRSARRPAGRCPHLPSQCGVPDGQSRRQF